MVFGGRTAVQCCVVLGHVIAVVYSPPLTGSLFLNVAYRPQCSLWRGGGL